MNFNNYYLTLFEQYIINRSERSEELTDIIGDRVHAALLRDVDKIEIVKGWSPTMFEVSDLVAPIIGEDFVLQEHFWYSNGFKRYGLTASDLNYITKMTEIPRQISNANRAKFAAVDVWTSSRPVPDYGLFSETLEHLDLILNYTPTEHHEMLTKAYNQLEKELADGTLSDEPTV